jgi:hypothetical protein
LINEVGEDPGASRWTLLRFSGLTVRGLVAPSALFSCPEASITEGAGIAGRELPLSGAVLSALFKGLLGEVRVLVNVLEGEVFEALADLKESRTLGRKGVNAGWRTPL